MSLIALMSVGVISLVVWLVLIFLSITDGIEKNWLSKLTSLNAPIRITPTDAYYHSYYYQIDSISNASDFRYKSIGEKSVALLTDPYTADDREIPPRWPEKITQEDGSTKDLVKEAFQIIETFGLKAQDYEVSGAVLKLRMIRPQGIAFTPTQEKSQGYLTQVSYISSFCGKSPELPSLIDPPRIEDLNHLFFLANVSSSGTKEDTPEEVKRVSVSEFQKRLEALLTHIKIQKMRTTSHRWQSLALLLPEGVEFDANAPIKRGQISHLSLPLEKKNSGGKLVRRGEHLLFLGKDGSTHVLSLATPLFIDGLLTLEAKVLPPQISTLHSLRDLRIEVKTTLQGRPLGGQIPWDGLEVAEAETEMYFEREPAIPPPWPYIVQSEAKLPNTLEPAVVLPKHYQNNGVKMGDIGYFSYGAATSSSVQEQRLPLYVAGFYDPGVMAIGAKCVLAPSSLVHAINTSSQNFTYDSNMVNGIQVYLNDLSQAKEVKAKLVEAFDKGGLTPYFEITTFHEYDFAKDLMQQFQSDKYLFTLIGVIVLLVACSNIISLLVILVNDKKREIAILSAMGATKKSIALIFTLCGGIMGTLSTLIGTLAAMLTLHHIDVVVSFLSFLQGHEAFNTVFYGKSLPSELSKDALIFIVIATPIISLLAGLVPAIKACKLSPTEILRSE